MASKKIITVFGATGGQGGSVVRAILGDSKASEVFKIRAITRNVNKASAKLLAEQGCEVVTADLDDKDSVVAAFKDAYGAFAVTNFWEHMSDTTETRQGKNVADAAKETGLKHLVWSNLINATEVSKGTLTAVEHFDAKARVGEYIRSIGIPASFFLPGAYMSNLHSGLQFDASKGSLTYALPIPPTTPVPLFDHEADTGKFVKNILLRGESTFGKSYYGSPAYITPQETVEQFKEVKKSVKEANAIEVPHGVWKGFLIAAGLPEKAAEDLVEMYVLMDKFGYYAGAELESQPEILNGEKLTTWKEYVAKEKTWKDL